MPAFDIRTDRLYLIEFLHQTTTAPGKPAEPSALYLIEFLHQTTTLLSRLKCMISCILLNFYIKPQLFPCVDIYIDWLYLIEFLHQTTTGYVQHDRRGELYLIEFLHQTTTCTLLHPRVFPLYLIEFLHQTTTPGSLFVRFQCFMPFCPAGKSNAEPSSK